MPDKIMKTLTIGNTKYTIQDTRVDSLENELDDKLDAPASAGTNGQVLTLNSSGNPVWQNPPTELPSVTSSDNGKMLTVTNGAWAKGSVPTELPSVTTSDNGKILKVTSGAWAKGDAPGGLPAVTTSDDYKVLTASNGTWIKQKVSYNLLSDGLQSDVNRFSQLEQYGIIENALDKTTFTKGTFDANGTLNLTGNGVITSIISSPWVINCTEGNTVIYMLAYNGDTCLGKFGWDGGEQGIIDKDSSTDFYEFGGWSLVQETIQTSFQSYCPEAITGVRFCFCDPYNNSDMNITNNDDAYDWAVNYIDELTHIKVASYDYVDSKLNNELNKKIDKPPVSSSSRYKFLTTDWQGNVVWQNIANSVGWGQLNSEIRDGYLVNIYKILDVIFERNNVTYVKGVFNVADGTYSSSPGIVSNIIDFPESVRICPDDEPEAFFGFALYNGNTYLGKINESIELDKDPSTGIFEWSSTEYFAFKELMDQLNNTMGYTINANKIRLISSYGVLNDGVAQDVGDGSIHVLYYRFANRSS